MTDKQLLQQALELEKLADRFSEGWHDGIKIDASDIMLLTDVATALRERLARQEEDSNCQHCGGKGCVACDARQEQEPVAWWIPKYPHPDMVSKVRWSDECEPLYTAPPARQWQGLTQEEMKQACYEAVSYDPYEIARAIEAKLKEKNA